MCVGVWCVAAQGLVLFVIISKIPILITYLTEFLILLTWIFSRKKMNTVPSVDYVEMIDANITSSDYWNLNPKSGIFGLYDALCQENLQRSRNIVNAKAQIDLAKNLHRSTAREKLYPTGNPVQNMPLFALNTLPVDSESIHSDGVGVSVYARCDIDKRESSLVPYDIRLLMSEYAQKEGKEKEDLGKLLSEEHDYYYRFDSHVRNFVWSKKYKIRLRSCAPRGCEQAKNTLLFLIRRRRLHIQIYGKDKETDPEGGRYVGEVDCMDEQDKYIKVNARMKAVGHGCKRQ